MSKERNQLEEIEDYDIAVKYLVYKDFTETEVKKKLERRGLDPIQIENLLNEVKSDYEGLAMIESSPTVKKINFTIDLLVVASIIYLLVLLLPFKINDNTLIEWTTIFIVTSIYYVPIQSKYGFTLGKVITGSRLIDYNLETPDYKKVFARLILKLIPKCEFKNKLMNKYSLYTIVVNNRKLKKIKPSA